MIQFMLVTLFGLLVCAYQIEGRHDSNVKHTYNTHKERHASPYNMYNDKWDTSAQTTYPFEDPNLSWSDRVDDLVKRLTLDELVLQAMAIYGQATPAIDRLGIKPFVWISECLRGLVSTNATAFPQSIGLAASFSTNLLFDISEAISYEARAIWNENVKQGKYETFFGINCFSPVINIARHPLWGRNQETYGEDPYLASLLVESFVQGLQGQHPRYIRASSTCKHFDAYAGPENIPSSRLSFNAKVSTYDWRMTFLPAFKACVDAGTASIMCSYNAVNGIPACMHQQLLMNITRHEWGFTGMVVSDAGAITNIMTQHKYFNNSVDTLSAAIKAGCNLELGGTVYNATPDAIIQKKLTETEFRTSIKHLFYIRMRLGEFDPVVMNPYNTIGSSVVQSAAHRDMAITAAIKTFVLLKNINGVLPLTNKHSLISIIGPMADNLEQLYGDYGSLVVHKYAKTPLHTLRNLASSHRYAAGCSDTKCTNYDSSAIKAAVAHSDIVIVCLGTGQDIESEGNDRASIDLPGHQLDLLKDTTYNIGNGVPVILLLFNAGPLDITWAKLNDKVSAIVECFFPAQATGDALYRALTAAGKGDSPAGRLPMTWPATINQVGDITNYTMMGRTYRYNKYDPLYPFGYGLSYTTFSYSGLSLTPTTVTAGKSMMASVILSNTGKYDADEVVQFYMTWDTPGLPAPHLQLVGIRRIFVAASQNIEVSAIVTSDQMALWLDDQDGFVVSKGNMTIYAGGQQPNQRTSAPSNVLSASFIII